MPPPEEIAELPPDGGPEWNRLVFEKSPYLLQHAGNPVDWFPWGEEAFEKARREDKPIFLCSTDRNWLVPHFEKMLYDQALLAMTYVEAYQVTGALEYERTAREILACVLRDMASPEGGFYSAENADSEGEEGTFYDWQPGEVIAVLGEDEGALFNRVCDVTRSGNFRDPHSGRQASIPHLSKALAEVAAYTALQASVGGSATAYVCRNFACRTPTTDVKEMLAALTPAGP